jgi:integrase
VSSRVAADCHRFQLLMGCRGAEIHDNKRYGYPPILVGDVDHFGGKIVLRDTKNRSDHKLLPANQTLQIVTRYCQGRVPEEVLFQIVDARKALAWINTRAGTDRQGHGLRATFASIAEELVSVGLLKRMMNHAAGGDVTLDHHVSKSEAKLRAGWQTVADFIDASAAPVPPIAPDNERGRTRCSDGVAERAAARSR